MGNWGYNPAYSGYNPSYQLVGAHLATVSPLLFTPRNDLLFASGHLGRFEKKLSLGYVGYVVARAGFLPEEPRPSLVGLIFLVVLVMNRNIPFS